MITDAERQELEFLRKSAFRFVSDPLERAFFKLESLIDQQRKTNAVTLFQPETFTVIADVLLEIKRELKK